MSVPRAQDLQHNVLRPALLYPCSEGPSSSRPVQYFHGGAYHQIQRDHWKFFERLIGRTGCPVTVPDYPLDPDSQTPETVAMIKDAYNRRASRTT